MMSKPYAFLILLSITRLLIAEQASAQVPTQPNYFANLCQQKVGNYTANSTYESNLKTVLSDLQSHGLSELFYNTSAGSGSNAVYGQYYCRGDVDSALCGDCVQQAAQSILRNCTLIKGSIIWYQECTILYSDQSVVGIEVEFPKTWGLSHLNVSDPDKLVSVLEFTINKLIVESSAKPSRFGTEEAQLQAFESLYSLVQCSPDLDATQCETCLRSAYKFIDTCCGNKDKQVAVFATNCQLRYSTLGAFYAVKNAPPSTTPSPPSTLLPSDSPPSSTIASTIPTKGASVGLRSSGVGLFTTALTFFMLMVKT